MNSGRFLGQSDEQPRSADRAQWAASAMEKFAAVAGIDQDMQSDPATVLCDLLADLMHWCDAQAVEGCLEGDVDFQLALGRARRHYEEELAK